MDLPIWAKRKEIIEALQNNQVVIVVGETGSGKTTQLPLMLAAGFANGKKIGITEPRRIAAVSVAEFVAQQFGKKLGSEVGYQIRFDDTTADDTLIKFMTDGILLRELQLDPDLNQYSVIMVDEAHERSQNIDFVLGLLKDALKRRQDLKVVVASATIDHDKFSGYFWNAPVVNVSGRTFPVEVVWSDYEIYENDMVEHVIRKVEILHRTAGEGDVLVFMTGEADINKIVKGLEEYRLADLVVLPIYGNISSEEQHRIFENYPNRRKVVVATNIAETSITVDGVVYVVDSGLIKQMSFHPESGIQSLDVVKHSQAGCDQRAGRAGRTRPGICYRMYTQADFNLARPRFTEPEIRRVGLASVVLAMEDIGLADIESFDFVDPPEKEAFHEAYETLIALGAIQRGKKGLTAVGKSMARLPLEPRVARMVLEAEKHFCVSASATIAAFLSVRSIFSRPREKEWEADAAHEQFKNKRSDLLTFLKVWQAYEDSGFSAAWCYQNFLNGKSLQEVGKIRDQIVQMLEKNGMEISENGSEDEIMKSVAAGLVYNLFRHSSRNSYNGVVRTSCSDVYIHPGSALFSRLGSEFFVAAEIVQTSRVFARGCSKVELGWLPELVPHLAKFGKETEIVAVLPDHQGALAKKEVFFQGNLIGFAETEVSLPEARGIQERKIEEAKERGWIRLVFTKVDSSLSFLDSYIAKVGEVSYRSTEWYGINTGAVYYCAISERYSWSNDTGDKNAMPMFQVFNSLSGDEEKPEDSSRPVVLSQPVVPLKLAGPVSLADLADKWGAELRKSK
ncbi:MAG: ATP-dependent RNA helicase [Minisyncoccia bacterium]